MNEKNNETLKEMNKEKEEIRLTQLTKSSG